MQKSEAQRCLCAFWTSLHVLFVLPACESRLCRERDSNPHGHHWPRDFKSLVSTNSTIAAFYGTDSGCKVTFIYLKSQGYSSHSQYFYTF